jgi:uncharacterized protein YecT (DUF1311 family)
MQKWLQIIFVLTLSIPAFALDNPDAPDRVKPFQNQVKAFEKKVRSSDHPNYGEYEKFLDGELNKTYKLLLEKLGKAEKEKLTKAQKAWVSYRDAEFKFISENWTQDNFGTSAKISIGDYNSSIVRDRVLQLLYYLQNYN